MNRDTGSGYVLCYEPQCSEDQTFCVDTEHKITFYEGTEYYATKCKETPDASLELCYVYNFISRDCR